MNEKRESIKKKKIQLLWTYLLFLIHPFILTNFFLRILNTHESKKGKEKNWNNSTKIILCSKSEIFRSIKG